MRLGKNLINCTIENRGCYMVIEESNLTFEFDNETQAIKFDDTEFSRKSFNKMPCSKGVDILSNSKDIIQFIEIKNCTCHEVENMWRTSVNNSNLKAAPHDLDVDDRDSLDIEVTKIVLLHQPICRYQIIRIE